MSVNYTPRTWQPGEPLTPGQLNGEIRDPWVGAQAAWENYTPTLTNVTLGNGTVTGRYRRIGKTVNYKWRITWGSTSSLTGYLYVSLPFPAASAYAPNETVGNGVLFNADEVLRLHPYILVMRSGLTSTYLATTNVTPADNNVRNGYPVALSVDDLLSGQGTYEAA